MVKRVEVECFRYYKGRFAAELPLGVTVIAGPVGSGKSSLLGAVEYALYGTEYGVRKRMYDRDELVNASCSQMRVSLLLGTEEGDYLVERIYRRGGGEEVRLETPEGEVLTRRSIVNEMLREMIGLDVTEFERTVFLNQVTLYLLAYGTPATRSRVIDSLLGIDSIEKITAMVSRYLKRAREHVERLESEVESLRGELSDYEERIAEALEREEVLRRELEAKRRQVEKLKLEIKELESRIERLKDVEKEYYEYSAEKKFLLRDIGGPLPPLEELVVEVERIRDELRALAAEMLLEEEHQRLEELSVNDENLKDVVSELSEILEKMWSIYNQRVEDVRRLEIEIERRNLLLKEIEKKILELEPVVSEYRDAERRLEILRREAGGEEDLRRKLRELELELKRAEAARFREKCIAGLRGELRRTIAEKGSARCPVCGSEVREMPEPYVEKEFSEEDIKREIERLRGLLDELTRLKVKIVEYEEEVERYNALLSRREEVLAEIDRISAEINQASVRYREVGARLSSIERALGVVRESLAKREKVERLHQVEERLRVLQERYEELQMLRRKLDKLKEELNRISRETLDIEYRLGEAASLEAEASSLRGELESMMERLTAYKDTVRKLECSLECYRGIQLRLRREMVERVSRYMREIVGRVYPYRDIEDVRLRVEEREGRSMYIVEVKMGGEWRPFTARLSEGQKAVVVLALLLSFFKAVNHNASFILLDEPAPNVDVRIKESIFRGVIETLGVKQVVFTTQAAEVAKSLGLKLIEAPLRRREVGEGGGSGEG